MVDDEGNPRVLDFGLAKLLDPEGDAQESISKPGQVMGTPAYMSPEQTQGDPAAIDVRTDVYSLGVLFYRLLTGQSPYGEQDLGLAVLLRAISETEPRPPRSLRRAIPDEVSSILLKSLEKDPAQRYQSAGEMGQDLAAHMAGHPVSAKHGSGWYTLRKTARRYRAPAATIIGVTVLSLALGLTMWVLNTQTTTELKEVLSEREVFVEQQSSIDDAARVELVSVETEVERLSRRLEREQAAASEVETEIAVLGSRARSGSTFDPPPPNPADPVNYVQWMNDTFSLDNAAEDYLAAYELIEPVERGTDLSREFEDALKGPWSGKKLLADWLEASQPGLERFRAGAAKSRCFFELSTSSPGQDASPADADPRTEHLLINVLLPHLSKHRLAAKALIAEGWQAWQAGDENLLADNAVVVLASARHFTDSPAPLIQFMVAVACAKRACDALRNALELSADPDSLAAHISARLTEDDPPLSTLAPALRFEQLWCRDFCQRLYIPGKRRGSWGLHWNAMSILRPEDFKDPPDPLPSPEELMATLQPHGARGYEETIQEINTFFDTAIEWSETPVRDAGRAAEIDRIPQESKNAIAKSLMPSLVRAGALHDRIVAHRRATHLLVHLFAYHAEHGRFPLSLDRLETPDLAELRIDPFGGKDFVYERTGKMFTLYSAAQDMTDNGGRHHAKWGQDGAGGDFVFWPVQTESDNRRAFKNWVGRTVYMPRPNAAEPVNYMTWMNENFWSDSPDNAEQDYFAAFAALRTKDGDVVGYSGQRNTLDGVDQNHMGEALSGPWTGHADVKAWLAANRPALVKFREATRKPKCFYRVSYALPGQPEPTPSGDPRKDGLLISVLLPGLSSQRACSKALIAEGWQAWATGDERRLPENTLVIMKSAHHLEGGFTLIGRLVATACRKLAYDALPKTLALSNDPDSLAAAFLPRLIAADPAAPPLSRVILLERMMTWDYAQRVFMPGEGPGTWTVDSRLLLGITSEEDPGEQPVLDKQFHDGTEMRTVVRRLEAIGFDETISEINEYYEPLAGLCDAQDYSEYADAVAEREKRIKDSMNPFIKTFLPSLSRAATLDRRVVAHRRATHLIFHIFAFRGKHGRFPGSLDGLNAPDLAEFRIDPFSGKDLVYKKTDRSFILYSVAQNLKDDHGRHHPKWCEDSDKRRMVRGDFVFWPVQE